MPSPIHRLVVASEPPDAGTVRGMSDASELPWWKVYNNGVRSLHDTGWADLSSMLSDDICALLDHVDAAFALTGAHTPGWPNPHQDGLAPDEHAYERVTDPDKFQNVEARARAWTHVLLERGWARHAAHIEWALRPYDSGGTDTILEPVAEDAVPLVLTTHPPVDNDHIVTVTVAAGELAVRLASIPDCGCDGCDHGSATLLEEIDKWVLSVVDGSLHVHVDAHHLAIRTSFGAHTSRPVPDLDTPTAFTAAPWPPNWNARPLVPDIDTHHH